MDKGLRAIRFIQNLKHSKGEWAGKPLILEEWQKDFIRRLFGTVRADGLRQYRNSFVFIPRKNSKSTMAAALCLELLIADGEPGAEIYSAANDRDQASLVFNEACNMIRQDKVLSSICRIVDSRKTIHFPRTKSFYRAISADAATKHGFNASAVVVDEYHEARSSELADVLETSMAARREPLMLTLTTAGADINSPCGRLYQHACKVRDGIVNDPTFLSVIFEAPKGADPFAEETWRVANPNYGVSVKAEYIREKAARARVLPTELNKFLRLHLNLWVQGESRWISPDRWNACFKIGAGIEELKGKKCWGGLDLASTTDVAAFVKVFAFDGGFALLPRFWVPKDTAYEREQRDGIPFHTWGREGHVTLTEGNVIDYDLIRADINADAELFDIQDIAVDRWNATQITTQLTGDGIKMVPFGQGFGSMSAPTKELEKLVVSQKLVHTNNPCLNWMAGNCVAEIDAAGNVKLSRAKSKEKIDGMVALVMGIGRAIAAGGEPALYSGPLLL